MRSVRLLAALALLAIASSAAHAQNGCVRLSWGSCDTWNENGCWQGPGKYQLVLSVFGMSTPNLGNDCNIRFDRGNACGPSGCGAYGTLDAWRFDDAGCEGSARLALSSDAFEPACPAMRGAHPDAITNVSTDAGGYVNTRMSVSYDSITPDPARRYTLWVLTFDLTHASEGPTPAGGSTCGCVDACQNFFVNQCVFLNTSTNTLYSPSKCDNDAVYFYWTPSEVATWNGGCVGDCFTPNSKTTACVGPVPAQPPTWGHLKALYR